MAWPGSSYEFYCLKNKITLPARVSTTLAKALALVLTERWHEVVGFLGHDTERDPIGH